MKIGRNAPCPCGSGKKYKKCCLRIDEQNSAEERQQNARQQEIIDTYESVLQDTEDRKSGPFEDDGDSADAADDETEESESDRIWDEFKDSDFKQKAAIIEKILGNSDLFEEFDCFELFSELHDTCQHRGDREVFKKLTHRLKREYPERYMNKLGYLLQTLIQDALIDENNAEAAKMFLEFADQADADIDIFNSTLDQMALHGDLELMLSAMHRGWEKVKYSSEIVPWGVDEYRNLAARYEIFKYVSEASDPVPTDHDFLKKLEKFIDPDVDILETYLAHITGSSGKEWQLDDFNYQIKTGRRTKNRGKPQKKEKKGLSLETFSRNVHYLGIEFLRYLTLEEGFFFPQAEIAALELKAYLIKRVEGDLEEEPSLFEKMMQPELKNKKKSPPSFDHILCPDQKSFDRFIGSFLTFFNVRIFRAGIVFGSIPAWLRFLEAKGLIEHQMRHQTVASIYKLYRALRNILENEGEDKKCLIVTTSLVKMSQIVLQAISPVSAKGGTEWQRRKKLKGKRNSKKVFGQRAR